MSDAPERVWLVWHKGLMAWVVRDAGVEYVRANVVAEQDRIIGELTRRNRAQAAALTKLQTEKRDAD